MSKTIYFAGGCFWGVEHFFKGVDGVVGTTPGYANGTLVNPSYEQVYTDLTGHAETVKVDYNPSRVSLGRLVRLFFASIDPLAVNRQGHDEGTRYRTGIYYTDEADLPKVMAVYEEEQRKTAAPFVVEVRPLENFYRAEDYHQDYLEKNPDGYCHLPLELFRFAREAKPERD